MEIQYIPMIEVVSRIMHAVSTYNCNDIECIRQDIPYNKFLSDYMCNVCSTVTGIPIQSGLCALRMSSSQSKERTWLNLEKFNIFDNILCIVDSTHKCPYYKLTYPDIKTCATCMVPNYTCPECGGEEWKHYLSCPIWKKI
jgi:hypothetical protein